MKLGLGGPDVTHPHGPALGPARRRVRTLQSNHTAAAFAAQHGVNPSTLMWWRSRLRTGAIPGGFVAVELPAVVPPVRTVPPLRLELAGRGLALTVPVDADLVWLRAVVDALT